VNESGQTVKGAVNIATSQSTSSTTYTTLATPDQVTGVVLPTNGLIAVGYQATWQESVGGAARAAIFIGANQISTALMVSSSTNLNGAQYANIGTASVNHVLTTAPGIGLISTSGSGAYPGDVTTGQTLGQYSNGVTNVNVTGGGAAATIAQGGIWHGFAAAGTYTVSVQFLTSSGTVTVSNRHLWVQALSFG
jgi:hypothetical protein